MEKSAFIIQGVLLFYLLLGLCMATLPVEVNLVEKKILRSFRVISAQQARKPLGPKERVFSRIFGSCCLIGCLVVLLQMNLQIGRIPETPPSVWTEEFSHVSSDAFRLHQLVRDIVQPMMSKYVGLVIVTIADDAYDISGFGHINLNSEKVPDQKTLFEIGSLSKVFTGTLLAERVLNTGLSLQASVASFLPFLKNFPHLKHTTSHSNGSDAYIRSSKNACRHISTSEYLENDCRR